LGAELVSNDEVARKKAKWKAHARLAAVLAASTVLVRVAWRRYIAAFVSNSRDSAAVNATYRSSRNGFAADNSVSGNDDIGQSSGATSAAVTGPRHESGRLGPPVSEDREESAAQEVQSWLRIVGLFAAPATVITALCYFYGSIYYHAYYAYFGIDSSAIGFTTNDYVMQGVGVVSGPLIGLLIGWGLLLWAGGYVRRVARAGRRIRLVRAVGWVAITVGTLSAAGGIIAVYYWPTPGIRSLAAVALGLGAVSVVAGSWMLVVAAAPLTPRPAARLPRGGLVVAATAIVLALYWSTVTFTIEKGKGDAQTKANDLLNQDGVVLDTNESLDVPASLIVEDNIGGSAQGKKFRYRCFRELTARGDRWVLTSAKFAPERGYALIVTADSSKSISFIKQNGIANKPNAGHLLRCPELGPEAPSPDREK
jgi:hypothetical protein